MITINAKFYKRICTCWKRADSPFVKREKILLEIREICKENNGISEREVVEILIADFKGQASSNNILQIISIIFSILAAFLGFTSKSYMLISSCFIILVITSTMLYSLRFLYAEGFTLQVLENYHKKKSESYFVKSKNYSDFIVKARIRKK